MAGVTQWRNDPDRPFRNIRRNKHGSRSNNRKPLDGSKPDSAGPMPPRGWPTDDPARILHQRREIVSASRHQPCHNRHHGPRAPSDVAPQAWDTTPGT
jgi:hypothetical protein